MSYLQVDLEKLMKSLENNEYLLDVISKQFIDIWEDEFNSILKDIKNEDYNSYRKTMYRLKGICLNFCIENVVGTCRKLENLESSNYLQESPHLVTRLKEELEETARELLSILEVK